MNHREGKGRGENPWNRGMYTENNKQNGRNIENGTREMANKRFLDAQKEMRASAQKHLQAQHETSSEEEDVESEPILDSVVKHYSELNKSKDGLEKTRQFLEKSFESGAGICLICFTHIKRVAPVWNCSRCYECFHIICIQKWAKDSIFHQKQAQEDLPEFRKSSKFEWPCPKCRFEYNQSDIPQKYYCFCGKVQDPVYQPFIVPHSCGEKCYKVLEPECGHSCLLLCHPGPCPPCPQTVQTFCHCKKVGPAIKRCSDKSWSCDSVCGKLLLCKKHNCRSSCHSDDCPPCDKTSVQPCNCGLQKRKQPCMTPFWRCDKVCCKPFSCGFHSCSVVCHSGSCGDCPGSLERSCPCGKSVFHLPCTEEIPSCNETCGKLLECNTHHCSQKCHKDKCGMCLEIVKKVCRCGKHTKELPCSREYLCGTKCKRMKDCARHPCNRKCCNMSCPPCEKQCGRTLSCGNHKCPSICHRGRCYPCPEEVEVKCPCGATSITVPCGREKKTKPPVCRKLCIIPPNCHHTSRTPHRCHYGECPPCDQICGKEKKTCPHICLASCHSGVWEQVNKSFCPSNPWEAASVQYKRVNLPCPECEVPVPVTCFGGHETVDQPCYRAKPYPCQRPCGRSLQCENHFCDKQCHLVLGAGDSLEAGEKCSECTSGCEKERPAGCIHKCLKPCHPGDCPPCTLNLKVKCHCGIISLYVPCVEYLSGNSEVREAVLSCGNPCRKTYPCGHPCKLSCHSGDCLDSESCNSKVKKSCKCGSVKKGIPCSVLRSGTFKGIECPDCSKVDGKKKIANTTNMAVTEKDREILEQEPAYVALTDPRIPSILAKYWYVVLGFTAATAAVIFYVCH